jgi:hypothetical protein
MSHTEVLRRDNRLKALLACKQTPYGNSYGRFFNKFSQARNQTVCPALQQHLIRNIPLKKMTLDVDSSVIVLYGSQEVGRPPLDTRANVIKMKSTLTLAEQHLAEILSPSLDAVESHPVFGDVMTVEQLRTFMEHHVFPVWDFMSLLKFLQAELAPATWPWMPRPHGDLVRLINDIVTGEESDKLPKSHRSESTHASHFDLYLMAMREVGADTAPITRFLEVVRTQGLDAALEAPMVPEPSRAFMRDTFTLLREGKAHCVAASFSFGRENVIPGMFNSLLAKLGIGEDRAPIFHYYLKRHAELDGDEHGPAALRLVATLCGDDPARLAEAVEAAKAALASRARLWDRVLATLEA